MIRRLIIVFALLVFAQVANAQGCVVCTKTAAGLGAEATRGLNAGILYLAGLPLALIGTIGFIWYRNNRNAQ
jgi:hypothetical protein